MCSSFKWVISWWNRVTVTGWGFCGDENTWHVCQCHSFYLQVGTTMLKRITTWTHFTVGPPCDERWRQSIGVAWKLQRWPQQKKNLQRWVGLYRLNWTIRCVAWHSLHFDLRKMTPAAAATAPCLWTTVWWPGMAADQGCHSKWEHQMCTKFPPFHNS